MKLETILITGANRGLGLGFVKAYLKRGWIVIASCREPSSATVLDSLYKDYTQHLVIHKLDVGKTQDVIELVKYLKDKEIELNVVINNAGISVEEAFGVWTSDTLMSSFKINVIGPALIAQKLVSFMMKGSKLIQISSGRASLVLNQSPHDGLDAYGMSKAALNMATRRLAEKLRDRGIIVISINPGWVQTDMGGLAATCTIEEAVERMTRSIDQLLPDDSGSFIDSDGKMIAW